MMTEKYYWTAILLTGLIVNLRTLAEALRRRRLAREPGRDGALLIVAGQAVRGEAVTLAVQLLIGLLVAGAWPFPAPVSDDGRQLYVLCGWTLAACSVVLTVDSILDLRDRRRLIRELARAASERGSGAGMPADRGS